MFGSKIKQALITTSAAMPRTIVPSGIQMITIDKLESGRDNSDDVYAAVTVKLPDALPTDKPLGAFAKLYEMGDSRDRDPAHCDSEIADFKALVIALGIPAHEVANVTADQLIGRSCLVGIETYINQKNGRPFNAIAKGAYWDVRTPLDEISWVPVTEDHLAPPPRNEFRNNNQRGFARR